MPIVTLIKNIRKPDEYIERDYSFRELYDFLVYKREPVEKIKQVSWSPARFKEGTRRANKNAIEVSCMVLDIDHGYGYVEIRNILEEQRLKYIMHHTSSSNGVIDKYRVVLPMARPVPVEEWKFYFRGMLQWFTDEIAAPIAAKKGVFNDARSNLCLDTCTLDPARAYFAGYRTRYFASHINEEGDIVDWEQYADRARLAYELHIETKRLEDLERQARREAHLKNLEGRRPSYSDRRRYIYDMLRTQKDYRVRLAERLGCSISLDRAEGFVCPNCNRNDATYFYLNPYTSSSYARCGHLNSCKPTAFRESLGYLAEITGNLDNL
jgi:hypothetical protein